MDFLTPIWARRLWLAYFLWELKRRPLLPLHDRESGGGASTCAQLDEEAAARTRRCDHG